MAMTLHRKITKVGNSLAVIIPSAMAEAMGVKAGSEIEVSIIKNRIVIEPADAKGR